MLIFLASAHLERMAVSEGVNIDYMLSLANFCTKRGLTDILLMVLQHSYSLSAKKGLDVNVRNEILQSIISILYKLTHPNAEVKLNLMVQYLAKVESELSQSCFSKDQLEFFFKICWNSVVEATASNLYEHASTLSYTNYKIISKIMCERAAHLRLVTLISCLTNYFKVKNPDCQITLSHVSSVRKELLFEAHSLVEDIQITSIYLPTREKRLSDFSTESKLFEDLDPLKMSRTIDILEFQVRALENVVDKTDDLVANLKLSCSLKDMEELAGTVMLNLVIVTRI